MLTQRRPSRSLLRPSAVLTGDTGDFINTQTMLVAESRLRFRRNGMPTGPLVPDHSMSFQMLLSRTDRVFPFLPEVLSCNNTIDGIIAQIWVDLRHFQV